MIVMATWQEMYERVISGRYVFQQIHSEDLLVQLPKPRGRQIYQNSTSLHFIHKFVFC